jgi:hypothetical protein
VDHERAAKGHVGWFIACLVATRIMGIYTDSAVGDLRNVYLLIRGKPWYSWTPFDPLFWPVVDWDEIRARVAAGEI